MNGRWIVPLRAALAVAGVYGFFLIFAQFSFVELLRADGVGPSGEKFLLGAMALAGVASGFFAAWKGPTPRMIRGALALGVLAAGLSHVSPGFSGFLLVSLLTGVALGAATVGLATWLPAWCHVAWVGVGTGIAYAACNVPAIFQQPPSAQAWAGAGFAFAGMMVLPGDSEWKPRTETRPALFPYWSVLVLFTALVWMDSAAFFIIQHADDLKASTWGDAMLWRNAVVHGLLACLAGWWLSGKHAGWLPAAAFGLLAVAALLVNHADTRPVAAWMYPAAVSLYSTALVAWPGWFSGAADSRAVAWRAAWVFAIAGWFGSANGIGMAQSLSRVPAGFVVAATVAVASALILAKRDRWRIWLALVVIGLIAWLFGDNRVPPTLTDVERGRMVYLSEGCLHCHSQYVRPGSRDETIWGGAQELGKVLEGQPVLIGNRRQGPDLTNVGARRSPAWLKQHFIDPRSLIPGSSMPSYRHLFVDRRGDDLVRYLSECGRDRIEEVKQSASRWQPEGNVRDGDGPALFSRYCAACHGAEGKGDGPLASRFSKAPANLVNGPFPWTPAGDNLPLRVSRVIKFGVPGTDMPGHEVMTDGQINSLTEEVLRLRKQ